jgi:hypothetical protein
VTHLTTAIREIEYDRASHDFRATVEGNIIGNYGSFLQAEEACDEYVYEMLMHQTIDAICDTPPGEPVPPPEPERCASCGSTHMVAPAGNILCLVCGQPWQAAPFTDVCPSCGDQLAWQGPGLCAACWQSGEPEPGIDPGDHGGGPRLVCPSCEAPTHAPGMCAGCRVEATVTLYGGELTMPQLVALAVRGPQ